MSIFTQCWGTNKLAFVESDEKRVIEKGFRKLKKNFKLEDKFSLKYCEHDVECASDRIHIAHYIAANGTPEALKCLLALDNLNKSEVLDAETEVMKQRPLHYAIINGNTPVLRTLLEQGAEPSVKDNKGRTPLHLASSSAFICGIKTLLEFNADAKAKDNDSRTPVDIAANRTNIIKLFDTACPVSDTEYRNLETEYKSSTIKVEKLLDQYSKKLNEQDTKLDQQGSKISEHDSKLIDLQRKVESLENKMEGVSMCPSRMSGFYRTMSIRTLDSGHPQSDFGADICDIQKNYQKICNMMHTENTKIGLFQKGVLDLRMKQEVDSLASGYARNACMLDYILQLHKYKDNVFDDFHDVVVETQQFKIVGLIGTKPVQV